jgi:hypothetical protein
MNVKLSIVYGARPRVRVRVFTMDSAVLGLTALGCDCCMVRVFGQNFALEDAIRSHACSHEVNMRVTNDIPLGSSTALTVATINCV